MASLLSDRDKMEAMMMSMAENINVYSSWTKAVDQECALETSSSVKQAMVAEGETAKVGDLKCKILWDWKLDERGNVSAPIRKTTEAPCRLIAHDDTRHVKVEDVTGAWTAFIALHSDACIQKHDDHDRNLMLSLCLEPKDKTEDGRYITYCNFQMYCLSLKLICDWYIISPIDCFRIKEQAVLISKFHVLEFILQGYDDLFEEDSAYPNRATILEGVALMVDSMFADFEENAEDRDTGHTVFQRGSRSIRFESTVGTTLTRSIQFTLEDFEDKVTDMMLRCGHKPEPQERFVISLDMDQDWQNSTPGRRRKIEQWI